MFLHFYFPKLVSPGDTLSVKQLCVSMMMKAIIDFLCINFYLTMYNHSEVINGSTTIQDREGYKINCQHKDS